MCVRTEEVAAPSKRGGARQRVHPPTIFVDLGQPGQERVLRMTELVSALQISRSAIYGLLRKKGFPKPIKLTGVQVGWLASEVREWIEARKAERADG